MRPLLPPGSFAPNAPRRRRIPPWLGLAALSSLALAAASADRPLAHGETAIQGGSKHLYRVDLEAGQYLRVTVTAERLDVTARVLFGDRAPVEVVRSDTPTDVLRQVRELALVAGQSGVYRIEVAAAGRGRKGRYRLDVEGPREPAEEDRRRTEAVRRSQGEPPAGGEADAVLAAWRELGDLEQEATFAYRLGARHYAADEPAEAERRFLQAIELRRRQGEAGRAGLAEALNEAGRASRQRQRPDEAAVRLEESAGIFGELHAEPEQAIVLANLGSVYRDQGKLTESIARFQESLRLSRKVRDPLAEGRTLNNLGLAYQDDNQRDRALECYRQALAISHKHRFPKVEIPALNNLADTYETLGERERAVENQERALRVSKANGIVDDLPILLNNLGMLYQQLDRLADAEKAYRDALRRAKQDYVRSYLLANLAFLDLRRKRPAEARKSGEQALALAADRSDAEAGARQAIGLADLQLADFPSARAHLDKALAIHRQRRDDGAEANVRISLARLESRRGDLQATLAELDPAIEIVESLRKAVGNPELRIAFFATKQEFYALKIDTLMQLEAREPGRGYSGRALLASEQARARSLREVLEEAGADPQRSDPAPPTLEEIQREVLDAKTLLLEYALGEERSYLWAVSRNEVRSFQLPPRRQIEATATRLHRLLMEANRAVPGEEPAARRERLKQAENERRRLSRQLAGMLLRPAAAQLGSHRLLVVTDGALQYIPFGVLADPAAREPRFLIQSHEVVHLPSASLVPGLRAEIAGRSKARGELALFADPVFGRGDARLRAPAAPGTRGGGAAGPCSGFRKLKFSGSEAQAIAQLVPEDHLLLAVSFNASKRAALSGRLAGFRRIHFATHGVVNSRHPEQSSLVLSCYDAQGRPQDGFLRLHDIYGLDLNAELVVLSACETALGKQVRGEGLIGLTRGFMHAGAARVVASLWSVDDRATAELMKRFYHRMLVDKLPPSAALRQAQLSLLATDLWKTPYYWAAFSFQGEWR